MVWHLYIFPSKPGRYLPRRCPPPTPPPSSSLPVPVPHFPSPSPLLLHGGSCGKDGGLCIPGMDVFIMGFHSS